MKSMKILIDTNVIMDSLIGREPFFDDSDKVLKLCSEHKIEGYVAGHTITNLFYLLRKHYSNNDSRNILLNLIEFLKVENIDIGKIKLALENVDFKDFEDCLQVECGYSIQADFIITRDVKDFSLSKIKCLSPSEFLKEFDT